MSNGYNVNVGSLPTICLVVIAICNVIALFFGWDVNL